MAYTFFFSYCRDDWSSYMEEFFKDLSEAVRIRLGLGRHDSIGFRDAEGIDIGQPWRPALTDALQAAQTLVCVYTPRYFLRDYCGKEMEFFRLREKGIAASPRHSFVLPIVWLP